MPSKGLPESKILAIDTVSQNKLNIIKNHDIRRKIKKNVLWQKSYSIFRQNRSWNLEGSTKENIKTSLENFHIHN